VIIAFPLVRPVFFPLMMHPIENIKEAQIQVLGPAEKFMAYFKVGFVAGAIIGLPFVLWQLWLFIKPGLRPNEQKWVKGLLYAAVFLFLAGAAFAFFVLLPIALNFLLTFDLGFKIITQITLDKYFSFAIFLILGGGLVFQIPLVVFFLSLVGIVSPQMLIRVRKYAFLAAVVLAAAITPTGDPVSLTLLGAPIYLLYEISILVSKFVYKKKAEN
jgi:sec-independent protein translocase protein TatC